MSSYNVGDVVLTAYGVGVIVQQRPQQEEQRSDVTPDKDVSSYWHVVRLWRVPGKSIGTSSLSYLRTEAIIGRLPAAPGMFVQLKRETRNDSKYLVLCYYAYSRSYLVSKAKSVSNNADRNDEFDDKHFDTEHTNSQTSITQQKSLSDPFTDPEITPQIDQSASENDNYEDNIVPIDDVQPAASAKFYPVLHALMMRGDQTAKLTSQLWQSETTQKIVQSTNKIVNKTALQIQQQTAAYNTDSDQITKTIQDTVPQVDKGVQQVLKMIKDQELTVLLEQCQTRLKQLTPSVVSKSTLEILSKAGVEVDLGRNALTEENEKPTQMALNALQQLLSQAQLDASELESIRDDVSQQFAKTLDSLAQAANADQSLHSLFQAVSSRTSEWQQATGRLLQTRSASLFLEGASRLQARAAALLQRHQLDWALGSQLTKAFTEGDAALARLKSIELGESVKLRLVEAIQVRSESLGGLDGIIAGALGSLSQQSGNNVKQILTQLQQSATSTHSNAHETLISILSQRSNYQDVALLRLEQVFCDLERYLGDDLSPAEIAAIAQGEGGTAKIFEPIARRAMTQIDKQITVAESQVKDPTIVQLLQRVRKIVSGELTISAVTDEIVNVLNDEKIVAAGETFVLHSESILDALECVSGDNTINGALQIAEKAGITKDSVMREIEKLNVNSLLDTAGNAISDEKARQNLISTATDTALDFVLRILPSLSVPPFEGARDGLVYHISNLSMAGFKVRKENIHIELAGMRATKKVQDGEIETLQVHDDGSVTSMTEPISSKDSSETVSNGLTIIEQTSKPVKATELLIIDIRRISAVLEDANWSFEQTYMPYLKGNGIANVNMFDGSIRLQFELRKRKIENQIEGTSSDTVWEPVLCLHDRSCKIEEFDVQISGEGRLTWVLNKLATIFKGPLRDYVVRTIVQVLSNQSGWLLRHLNKSLSMYWNLIMQTAKLKMEDLVEATDDVILQEIKSSNKTIIELVWRERLPLGMNLLMNDESGLLKVVDFPRGSQAIAVCEKQKLNPSLFEGATIISVNGTEYDDQEDLFDALRDPTRPKTVQFELANSEEAERLRQFVDGDGISSKHVETKKQNRNFLERCVKFDENSKVGIKFGNAPDNFGLTVNSFTEGEDSTILTAEKSKEIQVGDLLIKVDDKIVVGGSKAIDDAIALLKDFLGKKPLSLTFVQPFMYRLNITKTSNLPGTDSGGPEELILEEIEDDDKRKKIQISGFELVSGAVESCGIMLGDHLVFINGLPVGVGCHWVEDTNPPTFEEVLAMLKNDKFYPIGLTFARPKQSNESSRWSSVRSTSHLCHSDANTVCVTTDCKSKLGIILQEGKNGDVIVKDFEAVPGVFQKSLLPIKEKTGGANLTIEKIDDQFVPSYATAKMTMNAILRAWKSDGKVTLDLCDDDCKLWVENLLPR